VHRSTRTRHRAREEGKYKPSQQILTVAAGTPVLSVIGYGPLRSILNDRNPKRSRPCDKDRSRLESLNRDSKRQEWTIRMPRNSRTMTLASSQKTRLRPY
jgi:hypothetical protein